MRKWSNLEPKQEKNDAVTKSQSYIGFKLELPSQEIKFQPIVENELQAWEEGMENGWKNRNSLTKCGLFG